MNQILLGLALAALAFAGLQWLRADNAVENAVRWERSAGQLAETLAKQTDVLAKQTSRLQDFDQAVIRLQEGQQAADLALADALDQLQKFKPQPGDSDESLKCARSPVPLDVDRQLRE